MRTVVVKSSHYHPSLHLPIFFLVSFLTLFIALSSVVSASSSLLPAHRHDAQLLQPLKNADNETIYRVSKQLCWNCMGESLQFLFYHNLVRVSKWEFPLMWDYDLERYARWWAGQRKSDCKPEHSFPEGGFKLGENIYWGSGTSWGPGDAVGAWADEEKFYNYDTNSCDSGKVCGHYTQIVWKTTRRVGCARVICDGGDVFMTCNYDPVGNYIGERPY